MKQTIKLTESELRNYITEAVKRQLSEESYRKAAKKGRPVNETESLEITRFREDIGDCIEGALEDMFEDSVVYTRDPNYIRINCPSDENVYAEVITRYHGMRQVLQF